MRRLGVPRPVAPGVDPRAEHAAHTGDGEHVGHHVLSHTDIDSAAEQSLNGSRSQRSVCGMNLNGTTALVTGANRGLGRHLSEQLLKRGAAKVYADRPRSATSSTSQASCRCSATSPTRPSVARAAPRPRPTRHC